MDHPALEDFARADDLLTLKVEDRCEAALSFLL